jgi:hypothetical protein
MAGGKPMTYTCQNCGIEADNSSSLCNPVNREFEGKACDISTAPVCGDKVDALKFSCDSCGRVSVNPEHLCNPIEIK